MLSIYTLTLVLQTHTHSLMLGNCSLHYFLSVCRKGGEEERTEKGIVNFVFYVTLAECSVLMRRPQ